MKNILYPATVALLFAIMPFAFSPVSLAQSTGAAAIPTTDLVQPAELAKLLESAGAAKPLILQVGSHVLYAEAHIAGAEYAGPAGQPAGLQTLEQRVGKLDRTQFVVLYCGCCPWNKCPNIEPAYRKVHALGFTHLKVLYIANNFGTDWVDKGYPVAQGR